MYKLFSHSVRSRLIIACVCEYNVTRRGENETFAPPSPPAEYLVVSAAGKGKPETGRPATAPTTVSRGLNYVARLDTPSSVPDDGHNNFFQVVRGSGYFRKLYSGRGGGVEEGSRRWSLQYISIPNSPNVYVKPRTASRLRES